MHHSLIVPELKSKTSFTGSKPRYQQGHPLPGSSRGEFVDLPFLLVELHSHLPCFVTHSPIIQTGSIESCFSRHIVPFLLSNLPLSSYQNLTRLFGHVQKLILKCTTNDTNLRIGKTRSIKKNKVEGITSCNVILTIQLRQSK